MTPSLTTLEDNTLIQMALAGQAECFGALMDRHLSAIRRKICSMVRNTTDTDDLVQEVLFKVWRHLSTFRSEASFRTWVTRVAINEALQSYRRKKYHSCCETVDNLDALVSTGESPLRILVRAEASQTVYSAVAGLPEKYRQVLILREFEQLSLEETAKSLRISVPAAKSRLFRARTLLSASFRRSKTQALAA